jgi:hypothetical protein
MDAIPQRLQSRPEANAELNSEQWLQEFRAWVHGHSTTASPFCPTKQLAETRFMAFSRFQSALA